MTTIIDYGVGNLFSLVSSFSAIGEEARVSNDPGEVALADRLILPGVGAFSDAAEKLFSSGMSDAVKAAAGRGTPVLGICLGMQLLYEKSYEYGEWAGLGLVPGAVRPIKDVIPSDLKIPHIGWNALDIVRDSPIFKYIKNGDYVYFVHSFYGEDSPFVTARTEYGAPLTASVQNGCVFGCQFHPEKSGDVGLSILKAFCEVER
ncbi:MAG: imidazole glycerol phosphate synthase subunit HisH [Clostridia bacterium]|nr:imidazole glycerol phosphate synthase subunit HisH [Clostridia bacterium]